MVSVLQESAPSYTMIKKWAAYFNKDERAVKMILAQGVLRRQCSVHTARVSRQALKDTGFSEIDHSPYSPDLAPSDYFLFSNLKKELRGRRFVDDNQMKMAVESHFDCKEKEYFLGGLKALYTRCEKCISLEGDYIEK
ncbi:Mariner Mos1 transposase [Eumeta japonica]|uniref:Mariner Mos1 transposase n=1 Tax=Eumeta variegata TaxID=151549 RepID=A0A4C1TG49_EUMVA|nr:Mariner Mos1 transposase [Eumeta japonica]